MNDYSLYPDILGALSDERLTVDDVLQCAWGIFPATTAVDQPVEALLLLQNLINQPLGIQLTIRTALHDAEGNLANFFTPKPRMTLKIGAAECGLLHIPITPQLPTHPGNGFPLTVQIGVQKPEAFLQVRATTGAAKPDMLALSPFRVAVLREVKFTAQAAAPNQLRTAFDVLPGRFPPRPEQPQPRYESLWTTRDLGEKEEQAKAIAGEALSFAKTLSRTTIAAPLLEQTRALYGDAGMPLHPAEATLITKPLVYVMEDGLDLEQGFSRAEGAWFKRLCRRMLENREVVHDLDSLIPALYTAAVQDAVLMGFKMVMHDTGADFGDGLEQADYALKLVTALEGGGPLGLEHIYVPLVMSGLILHGRVVLPGEKQWNTLDELKEARDGRKKLADASFSEVFDILNLLIERAERLLRETRVPRK